jgi:hypothetical protein
MKHVICFYWQGERWYQKTQPEVDDVSFRRHLERCGGADKLLIERYINNLFSGIKNHSHEPLKFVCFTNEQLNLSGDIETRKIEFVSRKGVLPRMYMFSEKSGLFGNQVLCLDIDVIITGDMTDILSYDGLYCTRASFAPREQGTLDGDIQGFYACADLEKILWKPLEETPAVVESITTGRERYWIRHVMKQADVWQTLFPGQVVSYKRHVRGTLPANARIVSCHGYPRPHQINEEWIKEKWK